MLCAGRGKGSLQCYVSTVKGKHSCFLLSVFKIQEENTESEYVSDMVEQIV